MSDFIEGGGDITAFGNTPEEQEKAGTPKGPNNPYYAPATHPDEYADFKVTEDNDLEFIAGNREFWNKVYRWYNGN